MASFLLPSQSPRSRSGRIRAKALNRGGYPPQPIRCVPMMMSSYQSSLCSLW
jgi:hypothetical protein